VLFGGTGKATRQNTTLGDEASEASEADPLASSSSTLSTSHGSGNYLQADSATAVGASGGVVT
jgi:hypothetical protein